MQAANTELKLTYEGSVKEVYVPGNDEHHLWFHFTDDYSVFDWGKMPDTIARKGLSLALMGAHFFQSLSEKGVASHFKRLTKRCGTTLSLMEAARCSEKVFMEVLKADVHRPQLVSILSRPVYSYLPASTSSTRLVPLEIVFRFGMPSGSSLKSRLEKDPDYASQLGLSTIPAEGSWFDKPVLEFFTKLEPKDRLLTVSEALSISSLSAGQFGELCELALFSAGQLFSIFKDRDIELWDGKFEFILHDGKLLLADSIGPDELRLIYRSTHLSKEIIRQVYRGSAWEQTLKEAQNVARERGCEDWKKICQEEFQQVPKLLPDDFKQNIDHLYPSLVNHLCGEKLFENEPTLESLVDSLSRK